MSRLAVILPSPLPSREEQRRVILSRQVWESFDRLIALILERYEGKLPFWLAPEQVRVLAIGEGSWDYAREISQRLLKKGLRVKLETSQAKLSHRVHEAEKENVPYLVLLGEQEKKKQVISMRTPEGSRSVELETFLNKIDQESLIPTPYQGQGRVRGEINP